MKRVWFNHWFSTSYGIIQLVKQDQYENIYVIGSNKVQNSIIQNVCDEWYVEPDTSGEEYIDYCLDFCVEHTIDVFVPRRNMVEISRCKQKFEEINVKVMVDDYDIVKLLNSKADTYEIFEHSDNIYVPPFYVVNNYDQFMEAYNALRNDFEQVCVKFGSDEGGMSYRRIVERTASLKNLRMYVGSEIELDRYLNIIKEIPEFDDLMVMPYLPGEEISVDCLMTDSGLIAIPRYKGNARHEVIKFDERIINMVSTVVQKTKMECPCNVQFKMRAEVPYLLEINTRMSGGTQMSCLAAGVNIPNIALNKLLGVKVPWEIDMSEKIVSYIELPEIIKV